MIFITVGTQLPFDRLISAIDQWAAHSGETGLFAQIGQSALQPRHVRWERFMQAHEFRACFEAAEVIVAHAGMGTILTALDLAKPLVIVPRRAEFGEHRNDHQLATADQFRGFPTVSVVEQLDQLGSALTTARETAVNPAVRSEASPELLETIRHFLTFPADHAQYSPASAQ